MMWLFVTCFIGLFFGWMGGGTDLVVVGRLRSEGRPVEATVQSVSAGNSMRAPSVSYLFGNPVAYGGSAVANAANYVAGQKITVLQLPDDPSKTGIELDAMATAAWKTVERAVVIELIVSLFIFGPISFSYFRSRRATPFR